MSPPQHTLWPLHRVRYSGLSTARPIILWRRAASLTRRGCAPQSQLRDLLGEWTEAPDAAYGDALFAERERASTLRAQLLEASHLAEVDATLRVSPHPFNAPQSRPRPFASSQGATSAWQRELVSELDALTRRRLDRSTAQFLVGAEDEAAAQGGDMSISCERATFAIGLWANLTKSSRTKACCFDGIGFSAELPKTLALSSIALRAVRSYVDTVSGVEDTMARVPDAEAEMEAEAEQAEAEPAPTEEPSGTERTGPIDEPVTVNEGEDEGGEAKPTGEAPSTTVEESAQAIEPKDTPERKEGAEEVEGTDGDAGEGAVGDTAGARDGASAEQEGASPPQPPAPPPPPPHPRSWLSLGGVVSIDVLTLPPAKAVAKGWTVRELTPLSTSVERQTYPPPAVIAAPLKVSFRLPPTVVPPPQGRLGASSATGAGAEYGVALFDETDKLWRTDGVEDAEYDALSRTVSAYVPRLTSTIALVQPRHADLPFRRWLLTPSGPSRCTLLLETARRHTYTLELSASGVALVPSSECPAELATLASTPLAPALLFHRLRDAGVWLCPHDADAEAFSQDQRPRLKDPSLEAEVHREASRLAAGVRFCWSRRNQLLGAERAMLRVAPPHTPADTDLDEGDEENVMESPACADADPWAADAPWQSLLHSRIGPTGGAIDRYVALVDPSESETDAGTRLLDGTTAHSTPALCLAADPAGQYASALEQSASSAHLLRDHVRQVRHFAFAPLDPILLRPLRPALVRRCSTS